MDFEQKRLQEIADFREKHGDAVECVIIHGPWRTENVKAALGAVAPDFPIPVGIEKDLPGLSGSQRAYGTPDRLLVLIGRDGTVLAQEWQLKKIEEVLEK